MRVTGKCMRLSAGRNIASDNALRHMPRDQTPGGALASNDDMPPWGSASCAPPSAAAKCSNTSVLSATQCHKSSATLTHRFNLWRSSRVLPMCRTTGRPSTMGCLRWSNWSPWSVRLRLGGSPNRPGWNDKGRLGDAGQRQIGLPTWNRAGQVSGVWRQARVSAEVRRKPAIGGACVAVGGAGSLGCEALRRPALLRGRHAHRNEEAAAYCGNGLVRDGPRLAQLKPLAHPPASVSCSRRRSRP